jgi:hypothetical protein
LRAFERPTGAICEKTRHLSPLTLPVPRRGGGGKTQRGEAASAQSHRPFLPPTVFLGGRNEPEQTAAGAQRPTIRRRIGIPHASMDAGGQNARRRFLHQRAGRGRRPSRSDRSEAEPVSTRCRVAAGARSIGNVTCNRLATKMSQQSTKSGPPGGGGHGVRLATNSGSSNGFIR